MRVMELMSAPVTTVAPTTTVDEAVHLLLESGFRALPVVDDGALVGIVTEIDLLRGRVLPDPVAHLRRVEAPHRPPPRLVGDLMTRDVEAVPETFDAADVVAIMLRDRLHAVPVVDGRRVVGIVTRRDLLAVVDHAALRPAAAGR